MNTSDTEKQWKDVTISNDQQDTSVTKVGVHHINSPTHKYTYTANIKHKETETTGSLVRVCIFTPFNIIRLFEAYRVNLNQETFSDVELIDQVKNSALLLPSHIMRWLSKINNRQHFGDDMRET